MQASVGAAGKISSGLSGIVNEDVRRVSCVEADAEFRAPIRKNMFEILPRMADHFKMPLEGFEGLQFLVYFPGGFYKQHRDNSDDPQAREAARRRRISVVIFLNSEAAGPSPGCYGGGELTFYGLMPDAAWKCGFPLTGSPGLLIAFQSDVVHEVTPVLHGMRLTIATWIF
jgi:predicted 2-oxoglutarate/Fe(II)-dependent dioxygenase YbiX